MSIEWDDKFAADVGSFYGKYKGTFMSANNQVRADLFEKGDWLVAHVSFAKGYQSWSVTDAYFSDLKRYANEHGYSGKLQLILSGS